MVDTVSSPTDDVDAGPTAGYMVHVTADGPGWMIEVPALGRVTYAAHLRDVEPTVVDLIAIMTGSSPRDGEVTIVWPEDIRDGIAAIKEAKVQARRAQRDAQNTIADVVAQMKSAGQSYRDIGAVLGLSHQRVARLHAERKTAADDAADAVA
ncbi:hypothetical protein CXF47_10555 [Corynebacterium bovis]|nr:hypothetical protein CXF47_10555 [Corynebacterium bovis]